MNRYLTCTVDNGVLNSERVIKFQTTEEEVSALVPSDKLQIGEDGITGRLLVSLLDENANAGLIQLPAQLINGSDIVKVSKNLLAEQ